jgi:hypothetical protein
MVRAKEILTDADFVSDLMDTFDRSAWRGTRIAALLTLYKTTDITRPFFFFLKSRLEDARTLSLASLSRSPRRSRT